MLNLKTIKNYILPAVFVFAAGCAGADVKPSESNTVLPRLPTTEVKPVLLKGDTRDHKPTGKFTKDEGVTLQINSQGAIIPVAKNGKPFATCGTLDSNSCSLFKKGIKIEKMERINITKVEHQINPTCMVYIINYAGVDYIWYDVTDPHCALLN